MGSHAERTSANDNSSVRAQFRTPANPCEHRKTTPQVSGLNPARGLLMLIMPSGTTSLRGWCFTKSERWSAPDATIRAPPASLLMLGLVSGVLAYRCIEADLVCTLTENQLLGRARLELLVQGGDFNRQPIDEHLGHLRFPPGAMRITYSAKCPPRLVDQHGPSDGRISAQLGLCDDRRYSSEASHRSSVRRGLTGSVLRGTSQYVCCCRERSWTLPFQASRPGGKDTGGFPSRPTPGGEIRCRDGSQAFDRPFHCRHRPSPVIWVTTQSLPARSNSLGGAPFDHRRLAIVS
jgi:hypothetical protein